MRKTDMGPEIKQGEDPYLVHLNYISQSINEIKECLFADEKGLKIKVDRLVQSEKRRNWHIRSIWAVCLGFISKLVWEWFS